MNKLYVVNKYTAEGRKEIHKELTTINPYMLIYLMKNYIQDESIEYNDNRLVVYVAQKGKCAITGEQLQLGEMHCHHKKSQRAGGTDKYENLIFVTDTIHKLIHLENETSIENYISTLKLNEKQLNKLNELRELAK